MISIHNSYCWKSKLYMFSTFNKNTKKRKIKPTPCFSTEKLLSFKYTKTLQHGRIFNEKKPQNKDTVIALRYKPGSTVVAIKTLLTLTYSTLYHKMIILLSGSQLWRNYLSTESRIKKNPEKLRHSHLLKPWEKCLVFYTLKSGNF